MSMVEAKLRRTFGTALNSEYCVTVERQVYEERELVVSAASEEEALRKAWQQLEKIDPDDLPRSLQVVHAINVEVSKP
jgi:hypothetical protein